MATNERTRVKLFPTAKATDVLFYVECTNVLPKNKNPEYDTPYRDCFPHAPEDFPDHKLVFITPADDTGKQKWYFAADRAAQDDYNFAFSDADIGGVKFKSVERTYVIQRADFSETSPAMGSAMSTDPAGKFASGYILAGRKTGSTQEKELNSLYVFEVQSYILRATTADITTDRSLGVGVKKTTTLYYRGEIVTGSTKIEDLAVAPTNAYWGIQSSGINREVQQISYNWWAVIETSSRDTALEAYKLSLPTTTNLSLPDVLIGASIVWNKASSTGGFTSDWEGVSAWSPANEVASGLSGSESASAEASASIQPELVLDIRQPFGRNIPATAWFFYMKLTSGDTITSAEFLTKLTSLVGSTVNAWPAFHPVAHSIALLGQKVAVSAKASASASISARGDSGTGEGNISKDKNFGTGDSFDSSTMNGVVRIPPTIHGDITISGIDTDTAVASASCDVGWDVYSTGQVIAGEDVEMPAVSASSGAKTATATGLVSPSTLGATTPTAIPSSGYYVTESSIKPYDAGWVQCYAEVINAANI